MKHLKAFFLLLLLTPVVASADTFDDILVQLKNGSASGMVAYFNSNVELTLLDNEGIYSKQQAEQMLKTFFMKYPPKAANFQHRGVSAQGAKYAIAIYEASNGRFRTYMFMKDNGNGLQINEFRIERE